jgi:PBP1b-binding outer membrane lipoprotein LpoB
MKSIANRISILLFTALFLLSCGSKKETTKPALKNITDAVFASGNVMYSD